MIDIEDQKPAIGWIGPALGAREVASGLFVGTTGVMIAGLQPLLLGALQSEGRLDAAQLGHAATAELLAMGVVAILAGAFLEPKRLRWLGLAAGAALAAIDAITPTMTGEGVTLIRAAAGLPSGLMLWIAIGMITRTPRPERWSGVFLTVQTLAQFGLSAFLTAFVTARYGADGGFLALAAISAAAGAVAMLGPSAYAPLPRSDAPAGLPNPRGAAALGACFLFLVCIVGVWVYAEPMSHQAGHPPWVAGAAVTVSLAFQVAGGAAATVFAGRIRWFRVLIACGVLDLGLLAAYASLPGPAVFLVVSAAFGFVWLFLMPFLVPMTIEADPSRRSANLIGGAQLLGGSLGPLMASLLVTDRDARGAVAFGAAALVAAMGIVTVLHLRSARARP
ncbi:MAG: MFS transporter [Caulobacteraceae bacterium]